MEWKSFFYGVISIAVIILVVASFGFAHIGSYNSINGNSVKDIDTNNNIPEKCRQPAGQDLASWIEHLGHHAETKDCLKYFD